MWTARYVIENESGERYNLTAPNNIFMVNVEGLGATSEIGLSSLQDGFFATISEEQPQNGIVGELIYRTGAFRNYQTFVNWLMKASELYFCYMPQEVEYRRRVKLNYIQKDRRDTAGWMRAGISFCCLTPWYIEESAKINILPVSENDKAYWQYTEENATKYGYHYTSELIYGQYQGSAMGATVSTGGHDPAGFVLRYYGAIRNPTIRLEDEAGTAIGICQISATFVAGDILELSTVPDDCHVWKISGNTKTDLVMGGYVDLAYNPYPRIPANARAELSIESSAQITGRAEMAVHTNYRSV